MKENNKHISREISDYYIKSKQKQMKQIEDSNKRLQELIETEKIRIVENNNKLQQVNFQNNMLQDEYNSLKRVIKERGLIIDISNDNYELKEWDSLNFSRVGRYYTLASKKGEALKEYDERTSDLFRELAAEYGDYSALVIRTDPKLIRVQIRLAKGSI